MSKRNRREHGRILSVETMQRGSALDADVAAGATSITVTDAGDFDEDGGWLYIGAQVVEFTDCDDDTGIITLATALAAAAEQGDPVAVYDPLYGEVVDYQVALVQLDGEYDNPDPVEAEVAEGVEDLPEGDRGKAGESCTLHRVADDEWEVVGVSGRPKKSRGVRFHQDSIVVAGSGAQVVPLTFEPIENSEHVYWNGVYQPGTEWLREGQIVTVPDPDSVIRAGDTLTVEYAYRTGITTQPTTDPATTTTVVMAAEGVVGSTLELVEGVSAVGTGAIWDDNNVATYVQYSAGNARSPIAIPPTPIPTDGRPYTLEAVIDTDFPADGSPGYTTVGANIWQPGSGNSASMGALTVDPSGSLRATLIPVIDPTALAGYLNSGVAGVLLIGCLSTGKVFGAHLEATWEN